VDGKVITAWNGLAIGALARAGAARGESAWIDAARGAARAVLATNRDAGGALMRASLDGVASSAAATPADLGLFADGLFALALATGEVSWATEALGILDRALEGVTGDPLLTAHGIAASPDQTDGDLPSGAAALAQAALTAWYLGAGDRYREAAASVVGAHAASALMQPFAHGSLLRVAAALVEPPRQIVVVTAEPSGVLASAAHRADADVVAVVSPEQTEAFAAAGFDLFEGRAGEAERAYDCRGFVCRLPVSEPGELSAERLPV
jgi:uncharacterized protein YyaL (SSP411 family)